MEEAECTVEFRVGKCDIPLLAEALGLPDAFPALRGQKRMVSRAYA